MSNVPVSRRKPHDFLATHNLRKLRKRVTELAIGNFSYKKDKFEKQIENYANSITNIDRKEELIAYMREKNKTFYANFVKEETSITRDFLRKAVCCFEIGNSIFPSGEAKLAEFCERRKYLDKAIGWLFCLKQELMYIAEILPGDKNRYEQIVKDISEEVNLIKGVRKSSNRFLDKNKK